MLPFDQEPWQAELDSADRILCSSWRVGQVDSWRYPYWSEPHTKGWDNDIKMGHHRRPKSQMPRSMNIKIAPCMEFLHLMLKLVIQSSNWLFSIFLPQLYQTWKWPSMQKKKKSIVLKCAHTFEHTRQSFCKTIWLTNYSFTKRNLCLQGIWYHPLQGTTSMTCRKPRLFCSHLTTPHHYITAYSFHSY